MLKLVKKWVMMSMMTDGVRRKEGEYSYNLKS